MKNFYRYVIYFLFAAVVAVPLLLTTPVAQQAMNQSKGIIVIDAGHGGFDGGAVGRLTKVHEDVLNLAVCKKLQKRFEDNGYLVIMTRPDGNALAETKDGDMAARRAIIAGSNADIVISVHMNKFQAASASGPQVFYYEKSDEGEKLADEIQKQLNTVLKPAKPRKHFPETYYILCSGDCPSVIVECGFLSNEREESLLQTDAYQNDCARAIYNGAVAYLEQRFITDISEDIGQ